MSFFLHQPLQKSTVFVVDAQTTENAQGMLETIFIPGAALKIYLLLERIPKHFIRSSFSIAYFGAGMSRSLGVTHTSDNAFVTIQ